MITVQGGNHFIQLTVFIYLTDFFLRFTEVAQ